MHCNPFCLRRLAVLGSISRIQESGLLVFRRALDDLDAAMIAAGEPRSKICGARSNSTGGVAATGASAARSTRQGSDCGDEGGSCGDCRALSSSSADAAGDPGPLVAVAQQCSRLIFEMFNITDELLFYALKHEGLVGESFLKLAKLVYTVVFRHEVRRDDERAGGG